MNHPAKPPMPAGLDFLDVDHPLRGALLTPEAVALLADLTRRFSGPLRDLLSERRARQARWDAGEPLDFLSETTDIRSGDWRVAEVPDDLRDRRVEITGPPDRKMAIHALNSGATGYMADFEDSLAPTWDRLLEGQQVLREAARGTLSYDEGARSLKLNDEVATLMVRPRGLHLEERHILVDGRAMPGSLFDAGLFLFHNAEALLERGSGPYLYLPKLQHHREAAWWNEVLTAIEDALQLVHGTVKVTVLIETLPAAFQMDEILFALKDRITGLNCGRWDYIFSTIKTRRMEASALLPDRGQVTMLQPALRAYAKLLIQTCHRRGAHAMGGMAAQIPRKDDPAANEAALAKVREDKLREVVDGHDGTWVAHPALVPLAKAIFDQGMPGPNQISHNPRETITAADLLQVPEGTKTLRGLQQNLRIALLYLEAWLDGRGCVPIDHLMEDAATAEISRAQLWQWQRHGAQLEDGSLVDGELIRQSMNGELQRIRQELGTERFLSGRFADARLLLEELTLAPVLEDFLTVPAYGHLLSDELMARVG